MLIATKVRIYPTPEQAAFLDRQFGCVRYVWNWALEIKEYYYRHRGVNLSPFKHLKPLLAVAKRHKRYAWLKEADSMALQQALINLDRAYGNFFKKRAGKPRFKSKRARQSSYHCVGVKVLDDAIKVPKCTPIKAVIHRPIDGRVKSITLSREPSGKYYASILVEDGKPMPEPVKMLDADRIVALDLGLKDFAIASTGEVLSNPRHLARAEANLKRRQKQLSRKKKGSRNWQKARIKLANAHERLKNVRADTLHKWSRQLADENQAVIVETLRVRNMMRNQRLAKSIGDAGWSM
ncbi:RNA-guided endonuclease TnpB family protein, partial [Alcanivorax sp.]|uniref:RNA-guided endonuclease TnpB family protein n=1 Tax=Alcanivorax sp. TaxID=1872427 RepID=UPI00258BB7EF